MRENDKLLEKLGITYTLLKTPSGWKVVVVIAHDTRFLPRLSPWLLAPAGIDVLTDHSEEMKLPAFIVE